MLSPSRRYASLPRSTSLRSTMQAIVDLPEAESPVSQRQTPFWFSRRWRSWREIAPWCQVMLVARRSVIGRALQAGLLFSVTLILSYRVPQVGVLADLC